MDLVKGFHIIAVISWMAGMLYLPRLFVYHAASEMGSQQSETFKVMERRLYTYIMTPAMILAWILGIWLAIDGKYHLDLWFQVKFLLVLAMTGFHVLFGHWASEFAVDRNPHTGNFYRVINELPTLLMVFIVILAAVKPH